MSLLSMIAFIVALVVAIFPLVLVFMKFQAEKSGKSVVAAVASSAASNAGTGMGSGRKIISKSASKATLKKSSKSKSSTGAVDHAAPVPTKSPKKSVSFLTFLKEKSAAQMALKASTTAICVGIVMLSNFADGQLIGVDLLPTIMQVSTVTTKQAVLLFSTSF